MTASAQLRSGKGSRDENFPVASWLIKRRHRPAILAFYEFVRVADDIADHASLVAEEKLARLDRLERSLLGESGDEPQGVALAAVLKERGLTPRHAQDLLNAFRLDVTKRRYANWDELIAYCSLSAMPVGRFVLDVHGESRATWPANDALCAALQIINHLQDCGADYRSLDRVYVPLDALGETPVEALGEKQSSPALRECLRALAARTTALLQHSQGFAQSINDTGLALEVAAIQALASRLLTVLHLRDPLSEHVHLTKPQALTTAAAGAGRSMLQRLWRTAPRTRRYQTP
jgi:squalene synthase HpnC